MKTAQVGLSQVLSLAALTAAFAIFFAATFWVGEQRRPAEALRAITGAMTVAIALLTWAMWRRRTRERGR